MLKKVDVLVGVHPELGPKVSVDLIFSGTVNEVNDLITNIYFTNSK